MSMRKTPREWFARETAAHESPSSGEGHCREVSLGSGRALAQRQLLGSAAASGSESWEKKAEGRQEGALEPTSFGENREIPTNEWFPLSSLAKPPKNKAGKTLTLFEGLPEQKMHLKRYSELHIRITASESSFVSGFRRVRTLGLRQVPFPVLMEALAADHPYDLPMIVSSALLPEAGALRPGVGGGFNMAVGQI